MTRFHGKTTQKERGMKKQLKTSLALIAGIAVIAPAAASAIEINDKLELGGFVRMRGYNVQNFWDNNDDVDSDNWDLFRLKADIWMKAKIEENITGFIQFTNQNWGEGVSYYEDGNSNKVFVDQAYINVKNMLDMPLSTTIGRQNVMYGSGFILFDGQSQLGSTSTYLDGIKLSYDFTDKIVLDAMYMKDNEGGRSNSSDDDITVAGLYLTNKECMVTGAQWELYALNKNDEGSTTTTTVENTIFPVVDANLDGFADTQKVSTTSKTPTKDFWTYGVRLSDKMDSGFDYSAEIAIQKGDWDETNHIDHDALGYKLGAGYTFKEAAVKPRVYLGYAFMSGDDDPNDSENERWDVMYGGWPQFGDMLAFRFINAPPNNLNSLDDSFGESAGLTGEATYGNLQIATIGASASLTEKLSADISYSILTFDETMAGIDDDFGDYYQANLKYQYSKNLSFALYAAMIEPGDAFSDANPAWDDEATEIFWEAALKF